jgi:hypothetical protein
MKTTFLPAALLLHMMLGVTAPAIAAQRPSTSQAIQAPQPPPRPAVPQPPQPPPPQPYVQLPMQDDRGARDTREWFRKVLDQYPPSVRQVLRIDTSLLSRPDYLATYPALAAFLEQHPEVAHNPAYFVGSPDEQREEGPQATTLEAIRVWRDVAQFIGVASIVFIITSALAGVIKTLIDQHRWQRAAKMHMEIQNKLLDRFAGSGELLAYLETPTGRGLADLQLPGLGSVARPMDAPTSRIFWPLQTGIVLMFAGIGLAYMGPRIGLDAMRQPVSGFGALVGFIGLGFVASAIASFLLSHRLGLVSAVNRTELGRGTPSA